MKIFINKLFWQEVLYYVILAMLAFMPLLYLLSSNWIGATISAIIAAFYFGTLYGSSRGAKRSSQILDATIAAYENNFNEIDEIHKKQIKDLEACNQDYGNDIKAIYEKALDELVVSLEREKQLSRELDELALKSGNKSPAQLNKENGAFAFPNVKINLKGSKAPK